MAERIKLQTPPFRLSFPNLFQAQSFDGQPPKYGLSMLFYPDKMTPKQLKQFKALKKAAEDAGIAFFKPAKGKLAANIKMPFRDGDEKADLDGYGDGCEFANATSRMRPGIVDMDRCEIDDPEEIYPGCWCRATVNFYAYDNKSKGVAIGLNNVQKMADDESFSSRTSAEDDFADDDWDEDDIANMKGAGAVDVDDDDDPLG